MSFSKIILKSNSLEFSTSSFDVPILMHVSKHTFFKMKMFCMVNMFFLACV